MTNFLMSKSNTNNKLAPTIGLYGINGVYNYGCEAIVRGIEVALRKIWPQVLIKYASLNVKDDKRRLKGSNIEIIPREIYSRYTIQKASIKVAKRINLKIPFLFSEKLDWINDCDAIFSIGGDIYTIPPDYYDVESNAYYYPIIRFGEIVKRKRKKLIIWGASIGPFEQAPKSKKIFISHLKKADLIISREPICTKYLKNIGIINNIIECADPAFIVSMPNEYYYQKKDKLTIGINFSPLSLSYISGKLKIIKEQIDVIETLVRNINANIVLIPHVVDYSNINDDDVRYLKKIWDMLSLNIKGKVKLITQDLGFINTKKILNNCDIVIATRMHCAINAIETGVPTIFIAYSQKAFGMSQYIYDNKEWVIPLEQMTADKLLPKVKLMISKKDIVHLFLQKRMLQVKIEAMYPLKEIKNIVSMK